MLSTCFESSFVEFLSLQRSRKLSQPIRCWGVHLVFPIRPEKQQTWYRTLRSCFLSRFIEFLSRFIEFHSGERSKMSQPIRGWGRHLVFPIVLKNTNLVEDIEMLLLVKFCWIPLRGFKREVEMPQPIRGQGSYFVFPIGLSSFIEFCAAVSEEKLKMWKVKRQQTTHQQI